MLEQLKPDLEQRSVKVEELNTWTPRGVEEAKKVGCLTVPCVSVDGKAVIRGRPKSLEDFRQQIMAALR